MVVDMQGVDDLLTDPQMHTLEECYGMGDLVSKSEATQEQFSCNYHCVLVVIIVKIVIICSFLFYRLLFNHSFQINLKHSVTNCFQYYS